ncbi:hypothetical protein HYPDE_27933 [Hyphomicrobium denitrificans 1NES1]|uniref:Transmembrane protein n=1 Tax=Hyphomicrobium denitrificans 1NES1 TaxID=670307 RepID=N0B9P6_9HYPH|nr:hypothetical protein [Hyphomicrobium denitrificans]AGK57266.1 hypothetical protein HYPDE_27933 [Hyphomicrobium denitrificans 1NES1]
MHDSFARFSGGTIVMIVLVAALSIMGSWAFACAAPLAAVAALAGFAMSRKTGLTLVVTAWLSNQIVGFGFLHYPQTFDTFAWGAAIGISAIVAFLAVHAAVGRLQSQSPILTLPLTFVVAFAVYQLVLFVAGYPLEGSEATLSGDIVARVFEVNLASFAGLLLLQWAWGSFVRPVSSTRHA